MFVNHNASNFGTAPRRSVGIGGNSTAPIPFNENSNAMSTKKAKSKKVGLTGGGNENASTRSFGKQLDGNTTTTPARTTTTTKRRALGDISNRKNGGGLAQQKQQPLLQKSVSFQSSSSKPSQKKTSSSSSRGLMKRSSTALTPSRKANLSIPRKTQSAKKLSTKTVIFPDHNIYTDHDDDVEDIELPAGRLWGDERDASYDDDDDAISLEGIKTWREDEQKAYEYQLQQKRIEIQQKEQQAEMALALRMEDMFKSDMEGAMDCLDNLIMDDDSDLLLDTNQDVLGLNENNWRCDVSF